VEGEELRSRGREVDIDLFSDHKHLPKKNGRKVPCSADSLDETGEAGWSICRMKRTLWIQLSVRSPKRQYSGKHPVQNQIWLVTVGLDVPGSNATWKGSCANFWEWGRAEDVR
jgi:hypothetical protein